LDYRDRVAADLDRWIADGLVAPGNREAILGSLPSRRRLDAVTALIWVAGVLLGLAVIAFIAANWDGIPRLVRFGLLIGGFLAAAVAAAVASRRGRVVGSDVLLTVAALVFAAAIGLTGQIFDLTGDPPAVPYGAGAAAIALGLVGASRGSLAVGVAAVLIGDSMVGTGSWPLPVSIIVAPLALVVALRWHSAVVAHVASIATLGALFWLTLRHDIGGWALIGLAVAVAAAAAVVEVVGRRVGESTIPAALARIPVSWFVFGALAFFVAGGYTDVFDDNTVLGLCHRVAWIAISAGLIAYGRFDRQPVLTALGVVSLIVTCCALLHDLGLNLIVISLVFLGCSLVALVAGLVLRRDRSAPTSGGVR